MARKARTGTPTSFADALVRILSEELRNARPKKMPPIFLRGRICGFDCQIQSDEYGFTILVSGVTHREQAFQRANNVYLMIRATKPESRHGKTVEIVSAKKILGVKAFQPAGPGVLPKSAVLAFCRQHQSRIRELKLKGSEDIGVFRELVRFRWVGLDLDVLRPRFLAFAQLISEISGQPPIELKLFRREWRLKRLPKSRSTTDAKHHFGGQLARAIGCPECGEATSLIAQLDLSDPILPKTAMGRIKLPVFSCRACLGWEPAFYDISESLPRLFDSEGQIVKQKTLVENDDELDRRPFTLSLVAMSKKAGRTSKVGGAPQWIQGNGTPSCPKCRDTMTFVMQLEGDSQVELGDAGLLYTFVCPKCKMVSSLIQSH